MKKFFLFLLAFLAFGSLSAQKNHEKISFLEKRILKNALMMEVIGVDGNFYSGYLYFADSNQLLLSSNPLKNDSLLVLDAADLFQVKAVSVVPFGRKFMNGMLFSAAATSMIVMDAYCKPNDGIMIGPDVVIVMMTSAIGTPFSLLMAAAFPKEETIFHFRLNGNDSEYNRVVPYLKKRALSHFVYQNAVVRNLDLAVDTLKQAARLVPASDQDPESSKKLHFSIEQHYFLNNEVGKLEQVYEEMDYFTTDYVQSKNISYAMKVQYAYSSNIRPYFQLDVVENGSGAAQMLSYPDAHFYSSYRTSVFHLGSDYVFFPVNNLMMHRFELSLGSDLSYANFYYAYDRGNPLTAIRRNYSSFGVTFKSSIAYYFSRNYSLNLLLAERIMSKIHLDAIDYITSDGLLHPIDGGHFNPSNFQLGIGIQLHF